MQRTIRRDITLKGIGLHSGRPVGVRIMPAFAGHGIWFRRTDETTRDNLIAATWDNVTETRLCSRLENAAGVSVSTVEHLMAALAGCGVQNALIEIDGPEVPILDGSAEAFVRGILDAGVIEQDTPVNVLRITEPVRVEKGDAYAALFPCDEPIIDFTIEFDDAAIGRQSLRQSFANGAFVRDFCNCRTFCRNTDVEAMRAAGLALGGTLENAIVVEGADVLTPGGFRRADECVRHKMLDALGDLALAGVPILGLYKGYKAGHGLTNALLRALFAQPSAYEIGPASAAVTHRLPGVAVKRTDLLSLA